MKLAHTMVRVKDIEKSLAFYTNVMGLKQIKQMELPVATLYFLTDESENYQIELTYNHKQPESGYEHGSYFGHFAFETDNIDAFTKKLQEAGLEYTRAPFLIKAEGPKIAFLNDPDGYQIEIIERK